MHPTLCTPVTVLTTVLLGDVTTAFETPDDGARLAGGIDPAPSRATAARSRVRPRCSPSKWSSTSSTTRVTLV
jgi:hypothetical protein